MTTGSSANACV